MRKILNVSLVLAVLAVLAMTSCATSIQLQAQRTPTLDTLGIQRIAIMPFDATNSAFRNAASHATATATSRIQATNHFTLVNPQTITDARNRRESIENLVDATFGGQITHIGQRESRYDGSYKDARTGQIISYTNYTREVQVEFNIFFTRARDGSLIGPITKSGRSSDTQRDPNAVASVETLAARAIDYQLRNLDRDVAPYTIRIYRYLESEKNKALKPQMEGALAHVKGGNYVAARQAYLSIWQSFQSIPAAINASILFEATGETRNAEIFIQQVYSASGSPLAKTTLDRLQRELAEQAGVEKFEDTRSPAEKIAFFAVDEIKKVLPSGAKLWIQNNATTDQSLVNTVIDNMTSVMLGSGIVVLERQMIDLILKEQNFQMSGNVSDSDFVSIGNLAGASAVVAVSITGSGANRRIQVKVLDISQGVILMQSGTGSDWEL